MNNLFDFDLHNRLNVLRARFKDSQTATYTF